MLGGTLVAPLSGLTLTTWGKVHEAAVAGGIGAQEVTVLLPPPAATTRMLIETETGASVSGSSALAVMVYVPGLPTGYSPWTRASSNRCSETPFIVSPTSGLMT